MPSSRSRLTLFVWSPTDLCKKMKCASIALHFTFLANHFLLYDLIVDLFQFRPAFDKYFSQVRVKMLTQ